MDGNGGAGGAFGGVQGRQPAQTRWNARREAQTVVVDCDDPVGVANAAGGGLSAERKDRTAKPDAR